MLQDVEEPMLARLATHRDPGTPDRIVMEQHKVTHFPSKPWCKMCVESRGHDSPHREQSIIDAVVPQLQFDCGYMVRWRPSADSVLPCRIRHSFSRHPRDEQQQSNGCVTWSIHTQHTENQRHEPRPVDIRSFDACEEKCTTIRRFDPPASHE